LPEQVRRQSTVEFRQKSQQAAGEPDDNQKRGHGETGVTMINTQKWRVVFRLSRLCSRQGRPAVNAADS
jgi:hypothetical protein